MKTMLDRPSLAIAALACAALAACEPGERRVDEAGADGGIPLASAYFGGALETANLPSGQRLDTDGDGRLDPIVNGYTRGHSWVGAPVRFDADAVGRVVAVRYAANGSLDSIVIEDTSARDDERILEARLDTVGLERLGGGAAAPGGKAVDAEPAGPSGKPSPSRLEFTVREPLDRLAPPRGLSVERARFHGLL